MLIHFPTDLLSWGKTVVAILFLRFVLVPTQLPADRALQRLSSEVRGTGREADDSQLEPRIKISGSVTPLRLSCTRRGA